MLKFIHLRVDDNMIYDAFSNVYSKIKMHFYREVFKKWGNREVSLTTVETFCMEIIL